MAVRLALTLAVRLALVGSIDDSGGEGHFACEVLHAIDVERDLAGGGVAYDSDVRPCVQREDDRAGHGDRAGFETEFTVGAQVESPAVESAG